MECKRVTLTNMSFKIIVAIYSELNRSQQIILFRNGAFGHDSPILYLSLYVTL